MTLSAPALRNDDFTAMRQAMVASQLRTTQVNDPRIVAAMAAKLDASVERDPAHKGTRFVVRFARVSPVPAKSTSAAAN